MSRALFVVWSTCSASFAHIFSLGFNKGTETHFIKSRRKFMEQIRFGIFMLDVDARAQHNSLFFRLLRLLYV